MGGVLDRHVLSIVYSEQTVFIGPPGAAAPVSPAEVYEDERWQLLHPAVPDAPPDEPSDGQP